MGARGRRSAADLSSPRPQGELMPVDLDALTRVYGDRREAVRSLRRAERHGQAVCKPSPDGTEEWLAVEGFSP